jgi:DNA invertase Pin-like site-specific DNA recombinase
MASLRGRPWQRRYATAAGRGDILVVRRLDRLGRALPARPHGGGARLTEPYVVRVHARMVSRVAAGGLFWSVVSCRAV